MWESQYSDRGSEIYRVCKYCDKLQYYNYKLYNLKESGYKEKSQKHFQEIRNLRSNRIEAIGDLKRKTSLTIIPTHAVR